MKIMRLDNKNIPDLEYLANLGFETAPFNESDVDELKGKVRSRSFSYNSGNYFAFINLICGVFLGVSVFYSVYTPPLSVISAEKITVQNKAVHEPVKMTTMILDTVNFVKENFVSPSKIQRNNADTLYAAAKPKEIDSVTKITSIPVELPVLRSERLKEPEIRYIPNSPVIYIHDLKVTDYSLLYFRKNKFINLKSNEGINASFENKEDYNRAGNILEPANNYYLHEALADALMQFKNGNYSACISNLNNVAQFTGNDINCRFYYGMSYFYKRNYNAALKNLDECISNPNNAFLQEAEYYKAICLNELGNRPQALGLMKKISEDGGFYSEKAQRFLYHLDL